MSELQDIARAAIEAKRAELNSKEALVDDQQAELLNTESEKNSLLEEFEAMESEYNKFWPAEEDEGA